MDTVFVDSPDHHRYELRSGDELIGIVAYHLGEGVITLVHTEVRDEYRARATPPRWPAPRSATPGRAGCAVVPSCPYIASYIEKHPEYADLVGYRGTMTADATATPAGCGRRASRSASPP